MELFEIIVNKIPIIDIFAFCIFLLCIALSIYFRDRARSMPHITGKKIRSIYRKSWVKEIVKIGDQKIITDVVRNQIMVSVGLLSAIVISLGFIITLSDIFKVDENGNFFVFLKILLILALAIYAFFMILLETRTLVYIPVAFGVDGSLIKKYENMEKEDYVAKLLHESFDHFSNAIRAIFFVIALIGWLYNTYLFIFAVLLFTFVMVKEDYGERSEVTLF